MPENHSYVRTIRLPVSRALASVWEPVSSSASGCTSGSFHNPAQPEGGGLSSVPNSRAARRQAAPEGSPQSLLCRSGKMQRVGKGLEEENKAGSPRRVSPPVYKSSRLSARHHAGLGGPRVQHGIPHSWEGFHLWGETAFIRSPLNEQ